MKTPFRVIAAVIAASVISACSHLPELPGSVEESPAADATTPRDLVRAAVELLGRGDANRARAALQAALDAEPDNGVARRLMAQIDEDPRTLLNGAPRPYTVRSGETMSEIADRFLGDGLMFYALARYNGIEAPNQLAAGQTLMIPRRPGVAAQETAAPADVAPAQPAAPSTTLRQASRANQLRLQALQQLNTGRVDSAVSLLRQAQTLDADNPAIQRDLDRAVRLQATLRSRGG